MISFKIKHFYQHFDTLEHLSLLSQPFLFLLLSFPFEEMVSLSFNLNKNKERFYCSFFLNQDLMVQQDHYQYSVRKPIYHGQESSSFIWLSVTFIDYLLYAGVFGFWVILDYVEWNEMLTLPLWWLVVERGCGRNTKPILTLYEAFARTLEKHSVLTSNWLEELLEGVGAWVESWRPELEKARKKAAKRKTHGTMVTPAGPEGI